VALAVTPPHAFVLTVPHGLLVRQPLCCDGLTPPIVFAENSTRMSHPAASGPALRTTESPVLADPLAGRRLSRRSFIELPIVVS